MSEVAELPYYESKATPEQRAENHQFMYTQLKLVKDQEKDGVPVTNVKIRCGCLRLDKMLYMYRCLYCGIWFCKSCAEEHFGMRIPPALERKEP